MKLKVKIARLISGSGLKLVRVRFGSWSGLLRVTQVRVNIVLREYIHAPS